MLNRYFGWFKIGAEAIIGCQRTGDISKFFGRPGTNLETYNLFGQSVSVNKKIIPFLDQIQRDIKAENIDYKFENIQTYNYRAKTGGYGLSLHSFGIAIDINPQSNTYQPIWGEPQTDIPPKIREIFRKYGFQWGGDWPGSRDPMHFEWYGAELSGSVLDAQTGQKVTNAIALVNNSGAPMANGDYDWLLEAKTHDVTVKAKGYEDTNFKVDLFCYQQRPLDITLKPLPENLPGRITGQVRLPDDSPVVIPAAIYLDNQRVGTSNVLGDYMITGVRSGEHEVTARILLFPGETIKTPPMAPGEDLNNLDLTIGSQ